MEKSHIKAGAIIGILLMMLNSGALAILDMSSKILRNDLSSGFIVFLYKFGLLFVALPWILYHGPQYLKTKRLHFHILRSFFSTMGIMCFVQGLKYVDMMNAAALENVQYIITVLLGIIVFKDKLTKTKIFAMVIGFIGACIIVNPDLVSGNYIAQTEHDMSKYFFTMAAISFWSINTLLVKSLGNTEHNRTQMFYLLLFASCWSFPAAFCKWGDLNIFNTTIPILPYFYDPGITLLTTKHILLLILMGCCYFVHGIAYFNSLKHDLSIVIPFRYTKLIFSGILGYFVFDEHIEAYSFIGYFCVVTASFALIRYEVRRRRKLAAS